MTPRNSADLVAFLASLTDEGVKLGYLEIGADLEAELQRLANYVTETSC